MTTRTRLEQKTREAHVLNDVTIQTLAEIRRNDRLFRVFASIAFFALILFGVVGIYRQNQLAAENKKHIDCVVKLFTVQLPEGTRSRSIENPSTTCDIQFNK